MLSGFALVLGVMVALGCNNSSDSVGTTKKTGCAISNRECEIACDPNLGCVQCVANADCGAADPVCLYGTCVRCGTDAHCDGDEVCHLHDYSCAAACTQDSDCQGMPRRGVNARCDVESGVCAECVDDADCGDDQPLCDTVAGRCAECRSDMDCPAARPICHFAQGTCQECVVDGQCASDELCGMNGRCAFGCNADGDCDGDLPYCDVERGECVQCTADEHCADLALPVCLDARCVECASDADCTDPALPTCDAVQNICVAQ
jgi:hypothetical protein